jgi:hypothetical protein
MGWDKHLGAIDLRKCNYKEKELEVLSREFGRGEMYGSFTLIIQQS